jgi:glycosyltransferase involved in cell wall biosynthesis
MTRPTRTFVFHHHEPFGPFSLQDLAAGEARFGGSVARLRLLFAIAKRGHRVFLVGNVHSGSHLGVQAIETADLSTLAPPEGVDTVVFNNPPPELEWAAYQGARWPGARHVIWAGNHFPQLWMDRLVRREVDRIVCVSRSHRDDYRLFRGFERLEVSYSGIDKDFLLPRATPEPNTAFFVSVPRRTKGFDSLLHAWRIVRASFPEARLLVSGASAMHDPDAPLGKTGILDADLEAEFPDFFGDYPASARAHGIELLGRRSLPEVYETLSRCSFAIVNPGFASPETYCRSAVEAQAAGAAVVGARSGSLPEVVADGRTGLLARDNRPESLAELLLRLFRSPELAADMGRHGIAWSNWLADYDLIAPDWEFIAERAETDAPAPAQPWPTEDKLRALGFGRARAWMRSALPGPMLEVVRTVRRLARA